jgi:hypothetical protein
LEQTGAKRALKGKRHLKGKGQKVKGKGKKAAPGKQIFAAAEDRFLVFYFCPLPFYFFTYIDKLS